MFGEIEMFCELHVGMNVSKMTELTSNICAFHWRVIYTSTKIHVKKNGQSLLERVIQTTVRQRVLQKDRHQQLGCRGTFTIFD